MNKLNYNLQKNKNPPFLKLLDVRRLDEGNLDISFDSGQEYKRAITVVKIYGLVIVCLMSGATNIMALEGIDT